MRMGTYEEHWQEFMNRDWDNFVTLTLRDWDSTPQKPAPPSLSPQTLAKFTEQIFMRNVAKAAQRPIEWFYVVEYEHVRPHVHILLATDNRVTPDQIKRAWRFGAVDVETYDPAKAGSRYCVKTLGSADAIYDLSRTLPPTLGV